jgi:sirohydrochlorin ferrochelatase
VTTTLLAHGSPDPRHARDVRALAGRVRAAGLPTEVAFLEHDDPDPATAARALAAGGVAVTVVVPLLVGTAYHARVDVPTALATMRAAAPAVSVLPAEPIGLHPLVLRAAEELVVGSGVPLTPSTGMILAAAGSRDQRAAAAVDALVRGGAAALAARLGVAEVRAAFLEGGPPLAAVGDHLRHDHGCVDLVVATLVIADGILRDRIVGSATALGMTVAPGALADTEALARLVAQRATTPAAC